MDGWMGLLLLPERGKGRWQLFASDEAAIAAAGRRWGMTTCSARGGRLAVVRAGSGSSSGC